MELGDEARVQRFEALVHASPEFIAIAALDGTVEFVNLAGQRMVGMDPSVDVRTTSIADYLTPEGVEASIAMEQPAVQRDGYWSGQSTLRDWRGGPPIPVAVSSFLLTDGRTGEPLAMATVQHDLRELRAANDQVAQTQAALVESERRNRALLAHMSDVLVVVDAQGVLIYASPSSSRILGFAEGSRIGTSISALIHPDDRARVMHALADMVEMSSSNARLRFRLIRSDGTARHYEAVANNLLHEPSLDGIVVVARDVTEQHRVEQSQRMQARVLELIANGSPIDEALLALANWVDDTFPDSACSILLTEETPSGTVLRHAASPALPDEYAKVVDGLPVGTPSSPCAISVAEARPTLVADLMADERWTPYRDLASRCNLRSCWSYPVRSPASGRMIGTFAIYSGVPGLPGPDLQSFIDRASHLMGIAVDRHDLVSRLAHQATHDALTGLPNRAMLLRELTAALARDPVPGEIGPVVVFLDLDRLKIVNDSLGHERGDDLLVRVAERLPSSVPAHSLVARFGGDEFVVLCTHLRTRDEAAHVVEGMLESIAQPLVLDGRPISPSASAGVVLATAGQTATEVLRDADIAMYRAKYGGGSSFRFADSDMRQRAFDRLELEGQIRRGIDADEFRLFYQPVLDLSTGSIVGFEALVRWQHPERGLLGPASFVGLAEETGLIVPLGEWVLDAASATASEWATRLNTSDLTLSVNLSARQLTSPRLLEVVRISKERMRPWNLCLELTESTLMDDTVAVHRVVNELAESGVQLSIDDFGTGFSSLSYLTRLPVNNLKIDRSFITDLERSPNAATVAEAVISLGHSLHMTVIAEGIETEIQRRALSAMGCRYGQGYLLGKPADALTSLNRLLSREPLPDGTMTA